MSPDPIKDQMELKKLNNENKQLEKDIKQIEKSRWYKIAKVLVWPSKLFKPSKEIAAYKEAYKQALEENEALRQEVAQLQIEHPEVNQALNYKELKQTGQTLAVTENLLEQKQRIDGQYNETMNKLARSYHNEQKPFRRELYQTMVDHLNVEEIPEYIIRYGNLDRHVDLSRMSSFTALLNLQASRSQQQQNPIEKQLDDKMAAYNLADMLRLNRPWTSPVYIGFETVPEQYPTVIKPTEGAGSRGVYLAMEPNQIINIKTGELLNNWEQLSHSISEDLYKGHVLKDEWYMEELIEENGESTTDYKFYTFYGEVALILEITRVPEVKYCWWSKDGKRVSLAKYDDRLYKGKGVSQEIIDKVETISQEIPLPFMRIDFMKSEEDYIFNEFTPYPGNYDEFDRETDRKLGQYYLNAETRIKADLLKGKEFNIFHQWSYELATSEEDQDG
ncbi:ATP-grasp fold amidoligase family protein [Alkalibacillus haloalkaliphilus]|uniref:ATP-grasp fold amidoligase family protein n=1 Tax=Alkalibacillus haloalkaliphilus TaxID=94136 RepID=UPI0002F10373|nr:ATP-grasp fold amidoligase family protein [Alkalibacillus haloalkaliphilus]